MYLVAIEDKWKRPHTTTPLRGTPVRSTGRYQPSVAMQCYVCHRLVFQERNKKIRQGYS